MATPNESTERMPLSTPDEVFQDDISPAKGNALQAAVASILGMPLSEVPNFIAMEEGYEAAIARFYHQGHRGGADGRVCAKLTLEGSRGSNGEERTSYEASGIMYLRPDQSKPDEASNFPCTVPDEYNGKLCILRGKSPRGEFGHVVVARHVSGGKFDMVHDPHPDGTSCSLRRVSQNEQSTNGCKRENASSFARRKLLLNTYNRLRIPMKHARN